MDALPSSDLLRILVIDDDDVDRMAIKRNLKKAEPTVEFFEVATCSDAIETINSLRFDCAFVDYNLPDGNGADLVYQLRQAGIKIPLVALTGQGGEQVAVDLMKSGASDYIAKDKLRPDLIYRILQQCLRIYRAEQSAERARQQREELLEQREEFISRMTHDMQTPLVGANRMLELIQDEAFGQVDALAKDKIKIIMRSNDDLLKMVQDLVEVYTYAAGAKTLNRILIDVPKLVQEVFQQLEPLANDQQIPLELKVLSPDRKIQARLDRAEFKRVLINLVSNSIKFTETGRITVSLSRETQPKDILTVQISDTGIGISPEEQTQLFTRFRRGRHKRSNSGLGLYLCHQIVKMHQGSIAVDSVVGEGTTFTIQLPMN